jgi:hypothetical protein
MGFDPDTFGWDEQFGVPGGIPTDTTTLPNIIVMLSPR